MFSQVFYLLRSKQDGEYLVARPRTSGNPDLPPEPGFLLLFKENFEAMSYLNAHGPGLADRFAIESIPGSQLGNLLKRWGFTGVGIVQDPLVPQIEFLVQDAEGRR